MKTKMTSVINKCQKRKAPIMDIKWVLAFLTLIGTSTSVEVHFETPDSGFFLKHTPKQSSSSDNNGLTSIKRTNQESILSLDKFTIVQTAQPVSIRASYGPFSTKQTVPARYIVPDAIDTNPEGVQNTTAALIDLQQSNVHLDISAHLVRQTIPRDSPVLRVLFHAGADPGGHVQRQKVCVLLHVSMGNRFAPLKGRCMPEGEDGVCVAEVVIPSNWWPPLPAPTKNSNGASPVKTPQRQAQVAYSVFEPPIKNPEQCEPKVQIQPLTTFAKVPLVPALAPYKELRADDLLTMLVPNQPLYPLSKIHVPVFLQPQPGQNIAVFLVRARVKAGMRILGATTSSDDWNVSVEKENPKHTVARVTAFRKDRDPDSTAKDLEDSPSSNIIEVFSWLLEVANDTKEHHDNGRIVWSVSYVHDGPKLKDAPSVDDDGHEENMGSTGGHRKKLIAKVDIQKDDIQAVLPISKNWELMNTAVLTGRQVSQSMKVFIVSQAGKIADVTLMSSCQSDDESVLKSSSSCSSVYVDGSEARGSLNASIIVKYGTYLGLAKFIVWMPEFPLEVSISDFRLSQIKGWRVPDDHHPNGKLRKKRAYGWNHHQDDYGSERAQCKSRYQQSPVDVFARFLAVDQDSGRVSYLISRRAGLRVTDLVQPLLRIADPKIAILRGRILLGRSMGRTDVQVLSPITGRVIGAKEIRVGGDKVTISRLVVKVVSGLALTITQDSAIDNGYIAETTVTRKLTAQYQEGLLDIDLEFSDGAKTPLRAISVDDYFLLVESLDTEVVAFAPMLASHHPRVIAVGQGRGDLLRVTLLLSEQCRLRRNIPLSKPGSKQSIGPLASSLAHVQVDFGNGTDHKKDHDHPVQNDAGISRDRGRNLGDLADILIGIPLRDDSHHEPTVQARQHRGMTPLNSLIPNKSLVHPDMTTLEIGMYVLLTAFCLAIAVFVVSCVVYASKFKPVSIEAVEENDQDVMGLGVLREPRKRKDIAQNAHDWVWLGRNTMDRSSKVAHENTSFHESQRDSRIRITSNPMICANREQVKQLPFEQSRHMLSIVDNIDSSTYTKKDQINLKTSSPHGIPVIRPNRPDYKPPVPPHRNIGVTAHILQNREEQIAPKRPPKINHHQRQLTSNALVNPLFGLPTSVHASPPSQNRLLNAPLFRVQQNCAPRSRPLLSFGEGVELVHHNVNRELHQAEKLAIEQHKNAFQFDTITPKENTVKPKEQAEEKTVSSSDDSGGFVSPKGNRVKRATVVNQGFNTPDSELGPGESLGLDDLDMDYEQIMHYFDNLKESNA